MLTVQCGPTSKQLFYSNNGHQTQQQFEPMVNSASPVTVPSGWRRDLANGRIVYTSRSNVLLWSYQEVAAYLQTNGTCKCGLDCPVIIGKIFNFDPCVPSAPRASSLTAGGDQSLSQQVNLCNHKRKIANMATCHQQQQQQSASETVHSHQGMNSNQLNYVHDFSHDPRKQQLIANGFPIENDKQLGLHEITAVTPAITEVIPSIGHHIVNHHGHQVSQPPTQVVQLLNPSFQFASGAITVLHQGQQVDQRLSPLPIILAHHGQTGQYGHTDHMLLSPQLEATYQQIPVQPQAHYINHSHSYTRHLQSNPVQLMSGGNQRRPKKKYRSSRHPPTVAAILREAEQERIRIKQETELRQQQSDTIEQSRDCHYQACDEVYTELPAHVSEEETEEDDGHYQVAEGQTEDSYDQDTDDYIDE
ncbi:Methyl-CpG-binding domain protein 6 [Halotydeus destructor]|nr:Methyl-CpG-binding domain protein 6 [Halotydeus destructor]